MFPIFFLRPAKSEPGRQPWDVFLRRDFHSNAFRSKLLFGWTSQRLELKYFLTNYREIWLAWKLVNRVKLSSRYLLWIPGSVFRRKSCSSESPGTAVILIHSCFNVNETANYRPTATATEETNQYSHRRHKFLRFYHFGVVCRIVICLPYR